MPFAFRCGRLVALVLDSRGERDVFREEAPILGSRQWEFIDHVFSNLAPEVEAVAVVTPTPIASMDPEGQVQKLLGIRTDDVEAFKKGRSMGESGGASQLPYAIINVGLSPIANAVANREANLGNFKISNIDEARDQWSHKFSLPEQRKLLIQAGHARLTNRIGGSPRGLI